MSDVEQTERCPYCGSEHLVVEMPKERMDQVVVLLLDGLTSPTADRKQWCLEQALRQICEDDYVDEAMDEFGWESGRE